MSSLGKSRLVRDRKAGHGECLEPDGRRYYTCVCVYYSLKGRQKCASAHEIRARKARTSLSIRRPMEDAHGQIPCMHAGLDILRRIEQAGTDSGAPTEDVEIVDCGLATAEDVEKIIDENKLVQLNKA